MPSNSAQQTAQAQQGQQNQAEQFLAQQRQLAEKQWGDFFSQNPNPATQWGRIQGPSFAGQPSMIGGGTIGGPSGGTLQGATGGGPMQPGMFAQGVEKMQNFNPQTDGRLAMQMLGSRGFGGGQGTVKGTPQRQG